MKVFKTIVWTSLFWILALVGLRSYTDYQSEDSNLVYYWANLLPRSVKHHLHDKYIQEATCECPSCEVGTGEVVTIDTEDQNMNAELPEEATPQLLPTPNTEQAQTPSEDELAALQNKVAMLEQAHQALVQELQAIFSTPEGMKLLPAPTPVAN